MKTQQPSHTRTRLVDTDDVVGYRHATPNGVLYSTNGRNWSSESLTSTFEEPNSGLRDQGGSALYWGDIVLIRDPITSKNAHYAVICTRGGQPRLANLKTRGVTWLRPDSPSARQLGVKVGRIGDWGLTEALRAKIQQSVPLPPDLPTKFILWNVVSLVVGITTASLIQWLFMSTVGPVTACLGACLAQGLCLGISHRKSNWMSRERLLKLAGMTAVLLFTTGFCSGLLLSVQGSISVALAYGFSGAVIGATSTVISGDIVSWLSGGYAGELPKGKWNRLYP